MYGDNLNVEALKVGDRVAMAQRWDFNLYLIGVVKKLTKTQITVQFERRMRGEPPATYEVRFTRSTGREIGPDTWSRQHLVSEEFAKASNVVIAAERKRKWAIHEIKNADFNKFPDDVISQIAAIVSAATKKAEAS